MILNPYERVLDSSSSEGEKWFQKAIVGLPKDEKYYGSRGVKATAFLDAIKRASSIYARGKSVNGMEVEYAGDLLVSRIVNLF